MSAKAMKELREAAKLTQTEMAALMGLGKTAYVDLEGDDPDWKKFKHRHQLALERVSLKLAIERGDINLALPSVRRDALDLAKQITGDRNADYDFFGWLFAQNDRDDGIKELVADAKKDPNFPSTLAAALSYLSKPGRSGGLQALRDAIEEYYG